jgi:hypothetical protein
MTTPAKTKPPTPAQRKCLIAVRDRGVSRRLYQSHYPGGVTLNYYWMVDDTETKVTERVMSACIDRGWLEEVIGDPLPGTEHLDALRRAMIGKPRPCSLKLTEAGRALVT